MKQQATALARGGEPIATRRAARLQAIGSAERLGGHMLNRNSQRAPLGAASRRCLAAAILAALLAACGSSDLDAKLAGATQRLEKGDTAGAAIDAKAILDKAPGFAPARLLLAKALLTNGELALAEIELGRAAEVGAADNNLLPMRAELYLAQGTPQRVLDEMASVSLPAGQHELRLRIAHAHLLLSAPDEAEAVADQVLANQPHQPDAALVKARVAAAKGKIDTASALVHDILARHANHGGSLVLQGELLAQKGDRVSAIEAYRKAVQAQPRLGEAHSLLVTALIGSKDLSAAQQAVDTFVKAIPNSAEAAFYKGLLAFVRGDHLGARDATQRLLGNNAPTPQVLYLAGMTELQLGAMEQAEALLSRAVTAAPNALAPRIGLAGLYLRSSRPTPALATLQRFLDQNVAQVDVWRSAAEAYAMGGDIQRSDAAIARARQLAPADARTRTAMGNVFVARGDLDRGLPELQLAASSDGAGIDADLALAAVYMRKGDVAAALRSVDAIAAKRPKQVTADNLRGRILEQQGDRAGARKAYEQALFKQPGFVPAVERLVAMDLEDGEADRARKRYSLVLKTDPRASDAMIGMAGIAMHSDGSRQEVAGWLDKAVKANPGQAATWISALRLQRASGDIPGAQTLALRAAAALPDEPDLLVQVAQIQVVARDPQQALSTLNKVVTARPKHVTAHLALSELHLMRGNLDAARQHVDKALKVEPDFPAALRQSLAVAIRTNDAKAMDALFRDVQTRRPQDPTGWQLEAEVMAVRGQWPLSLVALRQALALRETTDLAVKYHQTLLLDAQTAQAGAWEKAWLDNRPDDAYFLTYLAEAASRRAAWTVARNLYDKVVRLQPASAPVHNNLAHVLTQLKDPRALAAAQKAVQLAPWSSDCLDTLAAAYAAAGQMNRAKETQAKAVALAPQHGQFRLTLSRYLINAGDKDKAREELEKLQLMGKDFPDQKSVEELKQRIG